MLRRVVSQVCDPEKKGGKIEDTRGNDGGDESSGKKITRWVNHI